MDVQGRIYDRDDRRDVDRARLGTQERHRPFALTDSGPSGQRLNNAISREINADGGSSVPDALDRELAPVQLYKALCQR